MRLSMLYDVSGVLGALSMLPRVWKRRELRLRPAWRARPTSWTALRKIAASAHGPAQMHGQDSGALLSHTAETTFEQLEEVLAEELGFDSSNLLHRLCGPPSIPCCSWRWWQVEQLLVEQDEAELLARLSSSLLSSSSASRSSWRRSWPGCAGWSRRTSSVSRLVAPHLLGEPTRFHLRLLHEVGLKRCEVVVQSLHRRRHLTRMLQLGEQIVDRNGKVGRGQ